MTSDPVFPTGEQHAFPRRLHHRVPPWVKADSCYHIRLRATADTPQRLTDPSLASRLLESVQFYHARQRWDCLLVLLMPDHAHALLSFSSDRAMSNTIGAWKAYTARHLNVLWQTNYFDHRIRDHHHLQVKVAYILRNPVVKGLCAREAEWPWVWPRSRAE